MSANNTMRENNTMSSNKTPVLSDNEESNVLLEGNPPNPTTNLDPHLQILLVLCEELDHAIIDNKSCDASALQKKQYRKVPLLGQSFDNPHTTQHSSGGITYGLFKICNRNKRDVVLPFVLESMQDTVLEEEFTNNKANWINSSTSDYANAFGVHMHSLYANIPSHVGKQYFTDLSSDTKKTAYHYRRQLQENESTTDDRLATQPRSTQGQAPGMDIAALLAAQNGNPGPATFIAAGNQILGGVHNHYHGGGDGGGGGGGDNASLSRLEAKLDGLATGMKSSVATLQDGQTEIQDGQAAIKRGIAAGTKQVQDTVKKGTKTVTSALKPPRAPFSTPAPSGLEERLFESGGRNSAPSAATGGGGLAERLFKNGGHNSDSPSVSSLPSPQKLEDIDVVVAPFLQTKIEGGLVAFRSNPNAFDHKQKKALKYIASMLERESNWLVNQVGRLVENSLPLHNVSEFGRMGTAPLLESLAGPNGVVPVLGFPDDTGVVSCLLYHAQLMQQEMAGDDELLFGAANLLTTHTFDFDSFDQTIFVISQTREDAAPVLQVLTQMLLLQHKYVCIAGLDSEIGTLGIHSKLLVDLEPLKTGVCKHLRFDYVYLDSSQQRILPCMFREVTLFTCGLEDGGTDLVEAMLSNSNELEQFNVIQKNCFSVQNTNRLIVEIGSGYRRKRTQIQLFFTEGSLQEAIDADSTLADEIGAIVTDKPHAFRFLQVAVSDLSGAEEKNTVCEFWSRINIASGGKVRTTIESRSQHPVCFTGLEAAVDDMKEQLAEAVGVEQPEDPDQDYEPGRGFGPPAGDVWNQNSYWECPRCKTRHASAPANGVWNQSEGVFDRCIDCPSTQASDVAAFREWASSGGLSGQSEPLEGQISVGQGGFTFLPATTNSTLDTTAKDKASKEPATGVLSFQGGGTATESSTGGFSFQANSSFHASSSTDNSVLDANCHGGTVPVVGLTMEQFRATGSKAAVDSTTTKSENNIEEEGAKMEELNDIFEVEETKTDEPKDILEEEETKANGPNDTAEEEEIKERPGKPKAVPLDDTSMEARNNEELGEGGNKEELQDEAEEEVDPAPRPQVEPRRRSRRNLQLGPEIDRQDNPDNYARSQAHCL